MTAGSNHQPEAVVSAFRPILHPCPWTQTPPMHCGPGVGETVKVNVGGGVRVGVGVGVLVGVGVSVGVSVGVAVGVAVPVEVGVGVAVNVGVAAGRLLRSTVRDAGF